MMAELRKVCGCKQRNRPRRLKLYRGPRRRRARITLRHVPDFWALCGQGRDAAHTPPVYRKTAEDVRTADGTACRRATDIRIPSGTWPRHPRGALHLHQYHHGGHGRYSDICSASFWNHPGLVSLNNAYRAGIIFTIRSFPATAFSYPGAEAKSGERPPDVIALYATHEFGHFRTITAIITTTTTAWSATSLLRLVSGQKDKKSLEHESSGGSNGFLLLSNDFSRR